jgi:hypothetical protein
MLPPSGRGPHGASKSGFSTLLESASLRPLNHFSVQAFRAYPVEGIAIVARQNRVTPFGQFEATPARGLLMGNRGILHDDQGRLGPAHWRHMN